MICMLSLGIGLNAQLVTNSTSTPAQLVQNTLLGNGVTVSNIQYTGVNEAIGYFNGTNTNIGLNEGVLITTGTVVNNGDGPHGPNDINFSAGASYDNGAGGYQPLSNIVGTNTYNAAVLEFDFVPQSDSVVFKYVFASEEYHTYVNSSFNDVFAFFISGPGIAGTQNMALIPGNNQPVTINNVNNGQGNCLGGTSNICTNCQYFFDNCGGQTIEYNGFTTPLIASSEVQCGETYHLTISIADVDDGIYDSGIFLEANSLSSTSAVSIEQSTSSPITQSDQILYEGCSTGIIDIERYYNTNSPLTIPFTVSGTATSGDDFDDSNIPSQIVFNPGETSKSITFDALFDGITEPDETIIFTFNLPDPCGNSNSTSKTFTIKNVEPLQVNIDEAQVTCGGDEVELVPDIEGGLPDYTYAWSTGSSDPTISVTPTQTETYTLTVNDACLNNPVTESVDVEVPVYVPPSISVTDDIVVICPNLPQTLTAQATDGAGGFTYTWTWDNQTENAQSVNVQPFSTTTYNVTATDQCGESVSGQTSITVTAPPLIVNTTNDTMICPGDAIDIEAFVTGGVGDYTFLWENNGDTNAFTNVSPPYSEYFVIEVQDSCQTFSVFDSVLVEVTKPKADFSILSNTLYEGFPINFQNNTIAGVTYFWDFGNFTSSESTHGSTTFRQPGNYDVTLIAWNEIGCVDSITRPIRILYEFFFYVPNAFTPNGDGSNDTFGATVTNSVEFRMRIYNRWGELILESYDPEYRWDGTFKGKQLKPDVFVYDLRIKSINGEFYEKKGHFTLVR